MYRPLASWYEITHILTATIFVVCGESMAATCTGACESVNAVERPRWPQPVAVRDLSLLVYGTTIGEYISTYGIVVPERNRTPTGSTKCSAVLGSTHSDSNFRSSLQVTFLLIVSYPQAIHWQQRSSIIGPPAGKCDAPSASHNYQSTSLSSSSSSSGSNAPRRVV